VRIVGGVSAPLPEHENAETVDLFDLWIVEADRQQELLEGIEHAVRDGLARRPGFVSAQIYVSEGHQVLLHVRTRTAADRRAIFDSAELQAIYRELRKLAASHVGFYRLVDTIGEPPA
jgi:hypothetical protein